MRFDLLGERERFIPGWHRRREPPRMGAEYMLPMWQLPMRLSALIAATASWFHSALPSLRTVARRRLAAAAAEVHSRDEEARR